MGVQDVGETGVFRQEAVAGMHRVGAGDLAAAERCGNVQIALAGRWRPDTDAFIGQPHMHGVGIGRECTATVSIASSCRPAGCAGDLAAIGDQHLGKHLPAAPVSIR